MKVRVFPKNIFLKALALAMFVTLVPHEALTQELASINSGASEPAKKVKLDIKISYNNYNSTNNNIYVQGVSHKKSRRWLNGKPANVNVIIVKPEAQNLVVKPSFGTYKLNSVRKVKDLVNLERGIAGINASYFKPDTGVPLGASIVNGEILTGPIYDRVVFGVTKDNKYKIGKLELSGEISIAKDIKLPLYNINQPVFSTKGFTVFTDRWGLKTPRTSQYFCHIVVLDNKIQYIKQSSVPVPQGGYVVVGPRSKIPKGVIQQYDDISYTVKPSEEWSNINYAVGGGPYLIKDGKIFIDNEHFSRAFLWSKEPRTAIGYTRSGDLILITVDGRQKGSYGATLPELAKLMSELGAYNAMNFDGGSSTQMVYRGRIVNSPLVKGGGRVTNALVIAPISYKSENL